VYSLNKLQWLQWTTHATFYEVHPQAIAASVAVQDVGKHAVLAHPISALWKINRKDCSLCVNTNVARLDDDDAFTRDIRTVDVGEYNVSANG